MWQRIYSGKKRKNDSQLSKSRYPLYKKVLDSDVIRLFLYSNNNNFLAIENGLKKKKRKKRFYLLNIS